jgi:hypothetical protein
VRWHCFLFLFLIPRSAGSRGRNFCLSKQ